MKIYETFHDEYVISTDKKNLDVALIHNYLCHESYWAKNIPVEVVQKSIDGSFCFCLYENKNSTLTQVGFARVITDCATFGYLADVFILESYRKKRLAKWLMETIMNNADLQALRGWMLATRDAHFLYEKFGFSLLENTGRFMRLSPFTAYPETNS